MDLFESSYYRLNKRQLFYLGLWPLQTPKERYFYRTIAVILLGSIILPEVIKFCEYWGNLKAMIECTPVLGIHFRCIVKFLNSHLKSKKLRKLTLRIKDDWTTKFGETDEKILKDYAQRGRLLTVGYTVYLYIALTSFLSMPMIPVVLDIVAPLNLSRDRINLFEAEYFVDQDEIFFYIMIHACITWTIGINIIIACDTMNTVFVQHICGSFARLGSRLQRIGGYVQKNNKLSMSQNDGEITNSEYEEIVTCIKMHNEAIGLFKLLEEASCISLLFIVGSGMLSAIASGFTAVTNLDKPTEVFRYTVVIIGELIHLLFIFWQGQTLLEHSQDIFLNAYNVDWNDISPRARRLLIMIMIRSWKPCNLTAGKVIVLTMENYSSVVTNLAKPGVALRNASFILAEITHMFYLCWQGHVLAEHSGKIFINAHNVNWYDISPRAKKLLLLIMVRSSKPCNLTAGKIFVLSMEIFAAALKTSMSYFTVLLSMQ